MFRVLSASELNINRQRKGEKPANIVLLRGCGIKMKTEPFNSKFQTKAATICPTAIIAGICIAIGIERFEVPGATGDYHSDLNKKAEAAVDILYRKNFEFCFLHVKGYDETGHDRLLNKRLEFCRKIEEMLLLFLTMAAAESEDCLIAITGDHSTPLHLGDHSYEPVPFTVCSKEAYWREKHFFITDDCSSFDEIAAARGVLGRFPGREVMPMLFKLRDRLKQKGFM